MPRFRFRAKAALELRQQQEQAAAAALARFEAEFREAEASCAAVERQRLIAQGEQIAQARHGIDASTLFWHRNWIVRLQATVDELRMEMRRRADLAEAARRAWQLARQRHLALDRMRQRSFARHRAAEGREERRDIDEVARLRFTVPPMGREE